MATQEQPTELVVECLIEPDTVDKTRKGPKPKQLKAVEIQGYEVGRGLQRRIVNPDDVYKLAQIGMTDSDIGRWFGIKDDTLRRNFAEMLTKGREEMKMTLRMAMFKNAVKGNAAVQIFLAKNLLGMSDSPLDTQDSRILPWED